MHLYVNSNETVTAEHGRLVYVIETAEIADSFRIVETWGRGTLEFATAEQRQAKNAIEAMVRSGTRIANRAELSHQDPRLRMFNGNVNPSGRASIRWAIGR